MNKIKEWTYLYKETNSNINKLGLKELVIVYNEKYNGSNKRILYMLDSMLHENIKLYNNLFKSKWEYIQTGDFEKVQIKDKQYINVLNIGDKASIYALFACDIDKNVINDIADYIAIILADEIIMNKVRNIKKGFEIVDIALDMDKNIYAIPGEINNGKSYLTNYMIKQGAPIICDISDIRYLLLQKDYKRG